MTTSADDKVKVSCLSCGTTNRFPVAALGKKVLCGRCQAHLPEPGMVLEPLPDQVNTLLRMAALPVLAEFYSTGCVHCQRMQPILERLAQRRAGDLMVFKINLDHHQGLGAEYQILGVPTFVVIHKGMERGRLSGAVPEMDFSLWLAKLV